MSEVQPDLADVQLTIITGLSGAGRSEGAKALEDMGWFVVDNLPPKLMRTVLQLALAPGNDLRRLAFVVDARGGAFFDEAREQLAQLREEFPGYRMVFFEAPDEALVRRFDANRRRHPLAEDDTVEVGIARERELMQPLRDEADLIVDTESLSVHDLRRRLEGFFGEDGSDGGLRTTVISFGYKHGLPVDADIVLDCRFIPNPHWVDELRPFDGTDERVREYVLSHDITQEFLEESRVLLQTMMKGYVKEGRHYLTIGVGCTGGRHRSVVLAEQIARMVEEQGLPVNVSHRDVRRATVSS